MFTYLKQMKGHAKNMKGRFINIILASMQITTPILTITSLIVNITQQSALSQITKGYVTLSLVVGIDDMFAPTLPADIRENADNLNKSQMLRLSKDNNSYTLIFGRIKKLILSYVCCFSKKHQHWARTQRHLTQGLPDEFMNLIVNIWYTILMNFQVIIFNYFCGVLCIIVQIVGFYYTMYNEKTVKAQGW